MIHTMEGDMISNMGCLPCLNDVKKWYEETGKIWACHENPTLPCTGFLKQMKRLGIKVSVNKDTKLITERTTLEEIYQEALTQYPETLKNSYEKIIN
jgi:hypothetical protein